MWPWNLASKTNRTTCSHCSGESISCRRGPFKRCHGDSVCVPVLFGACAGESLGESNISWLSFAMAHYRVSKETYKQTNTDKTRDVMRRCRFFTAELWHAVIDECVSVKLCCKKAPWRIKETHLALKSLLISCKCVWICSNFAFLRDVWMFESVCMKLGFTRV